MSLFVYRMVLTRPAKITKTVLIDDRKLKKILEALICQTIGNFHFRIFLAVWDCFAIKWALDAVEKLVARAPKIGHVNV